MSKRKQDAHWSDEKMRELARHVERIEKENKEFFEKLGVSAHQIQEFLNDPTNFSKPVYEVIKRQRDVLLAALDRQIKESLPQKRSPGRLEVGAKGHWIFLR